MATLIIGIKLGRMKKDEMLSSIVKQKYKKLLEKWVVPALLKKLKPRADLAAKELDLMRENLMTRLSSNMRGDETPRIFLHRRTWYYGFSEKLGETTSVAPHRIQDKMDRVAADACKKRLPVISVVCRGAVKFPG